MNVFKSLLNRHGVLYKIERNDIIIFEQEGLPNEEQSSKKVYIGFMPGTDIIIGDWIVNPHGDRFYVYDTNTSYAFKKAQELQCFYKTKTEHETVTLTPQVIAENFYGAVFGDNNTNISINLDMSMKDIKLRIYEEDSVDKDELLSLISFIEDVQSEKKLPKKGILSKFSKVMERNSWITGAIAGQLLSWLVG